MKTDDDVADDAIPIALENAARLHWLKHRWGRTFGSQEKAVDGEFEKLPKYREAMRHPDKVYNHPRDIVEDESLNRPQKLNILIYWAAEASQQQQTNQSAGYHDDLNLLVDITSSLKEIVDCERPTP